MFTTIVLQPLYNLLTLLTHFAPSNHIWIAISILTLLVKICLVPLYKKQVLSQITMQHIAPKLKELQEKYKDNKEELAKQTIEIYKKYKVNPLSFILSLFIQMPIFFALYRIFSHNLEFYKDLIYTTTASILQFPDAVNYTFLNIDLLGKSLVLAIIAGASQFMLGTIMFKKPEEIQDKNKKVDTQTEFMNAMNTQMKFVLPIIIAGTSYALPAAVSFYFIVGNIFAIYQELYIKKPFEKKLKLELN
jgi:YidC/Oxa1 family membrane protein insertase